MPEVTVPETNTRRGVEQILDVRENSEVAEGMIPGAVHIPIGELHGRLNELDPAVPVIAVCRSGNRSATAADALNQAGFTAATMTGGMIAWQRADLPTT
ncbi:rhodanese-like domain-containing protein [Arthrobacter echini]|uniref:Rhodanese-like domain-containing protein n=2 Tax=Arthrobacter echini TaxID=1529066 RepID=A0A4S5E074_9MICC|nr:rhodanese-like domain-containing protein [Arthrobacter echini]THJ64691.1 rhodanese-like domain-containing protein [Arthrobacter echini]TYC97115.1 rhodanese-like domain-containing protein [Arthrobacter echini]